MGMASQFRPPPGEYRDHSAALLCAFDLLEVDGEDLLAQTPSSSARAS